MNDSDMIVNLMLRASWIGMALGVASGALIGLFFAREDWMGGYGSFRRRLMRLGHISFFGLALVNAVFAFTHHAVGIAAGWAGVGAGAFLLGAGSMPVVCFLSAWRKPLRHLFFIPVGAVATGIVCTLAGWS